LGRFWGIRMGILGGKLDDISGVLETGQAVENATKAAGNLGSAIVKNLNGKGSDEILDDYQGLIRNQELGLQSKRNKTLKEAIKNLIKNPDALEEQLEKISNKAVGANGIEGDVDIEFYNTKDGNMGGHKDGKIYINLAYQDGSSTKMMEALGDELSHYVDYKKGRPNSNLDPKRQPISREYGDNAGRQTKGYVGSEDVDMDSFQQRLKDQTHDFSATNQEVENTEGMENRGPESLEGLVRYAYYRDTGRNADEDWERGMKKAAVAPYNAAAEILNSNKTEFAARGFLSVSPFIPVVWPAVPYVAAYVAIQDFVPPGVAILPVIKLDEEEE